MENLPTNVNVGLGIINEMSSEISISVADFHFPFWGEDSYVDAAIEVTMDDLVTEVQQFGLKIKDDHMLISQSLIGFKEVIQDILTRKAKVQNNTWIHKSHSSKVPHPLKALANAEGSELSWHEKMMEMYKKKRKIPTENIKEAIPPLERAVKRQWKPMDVAFDEEVDKWLISEVTIGDTAKKS
ncbi:hypothetical protein R1flu_020807 [Riccia fluitans]|uniref:Uncharacterized protein n=1 Tax=Riccia fluitans TaxID=41844 RepID=A0ABD1ZMK4_9MARC